jgi:hypothetical protein
VISKVANLEGNARRKKELMERNQNMYDAVNIPFGLH